jgi:hypothetical protein
MLTCKLLDGERPRHLDEEIHSGRNLSVVAIVMKGLAIGRV